MKLAEKMALQAAPCMYDDPDVGSKSCEDIGACGGTFGPCEKCACRPAFQAEIEKTILACQKRARWWHDEVDAARARDLESVDEAILALITDDVEDGA